MAGAEERTSGEKQCIQLADEMSTLFSADADASTAHEATSAVCSAAQLCTQHEEHVQEIVAELASSVASSRERAHSELPQAERSADEKAEKLTHARDQAHASYTQLQSRARSLQQQHEHIHSRLMHVREEEAQIDAMLAHDFPKLKHELGMYAHISQLALDHSTLRDHDQQSRVKADDERISGVACVSNNDAAPSREVVFSGRVHLPGSDVHRLDLDPGSLSDYAITNAIWDAIGSGVAAP